MEAMRFKVLWMLRLRLYGKITFESSLASAAPLNLASYVVWCYEKAQNKHKEVRGHA